MSEDRVEKIWVIINTQFEGLHYWKDAPESVYFLKHAHRHIFHVRVEMSVEGVDRDVEIILCKRFINEQLNDMKPTIAMEGWSCEKIASTLAKVLYTSYSSNEIIVEVLEDGENGGKFEIREQQKSV